MGLPQHMLCLILTFAYPRKQEGAGGRGLMSHPWFRVPVTFCVCIGLKGGASVLKSLLVDTILSTTTDVCLFAGLSGCVCEALQTAQEWRQGSNRTRRWACWRHWHTSWCKTSGTIRNPTSKLLAPDPSACLL